MNCSVTVDNVIIFRMVGKGRRQKVYDTVDDRYFIAMMNAHRFPWWGSDAIYVALEDEGSNCFSITQLVGQKRQ